VTWPAGPDPDLDGITLAASREAGHVPPSLLSDYLPVLLAVASSGRRLSAAELDGYQRAGEQAAQGGVALKGLVDLYLSATWRLWRDLPAPAASAVSVPAGRALLATESLRAAGLAVLRAADDAVAAAAEGFERAHLSLARRQEAERLEFIEDLLAGRARPASLMIRGERLGLRLAGPQQVVLAGQAGPAGAVPGRPLGPDLERAVAAAAAPAPSLTATRAGQVVAITGAAGGREARRVAAALARALGGFPAGAPGWRLAIGRAYPGPGGARRSYEEATDALAVAERLGLADPIADAAQLLVYQVLFRDQAALADLVGSLLGPLETARGGAGPLLDTLAAYYAGGQVTAVAARQLNLSVRAVSYRLARVRELTGHDPADPALALSLQVAVTGARLLDWPARALTRD
jgi:sugar diacid utilization regulator